MTKICDLKGQIYHRLTVIEFAGLSKDKKSLWKCQCSCENKTIKIYRSHTLKIGNAKSCGCLKKPGLIECDERIREKLLKNSIRVGECLEWQGYIPSDGYHYGMIYYPKTKKYHSVHRLSYLVFKGNIEKDICVLHSCDNNRCIEPNHLTLGTKSENSKDMWDRKRIISRKGEKHHKSKLKDKDILEIRKLRKEGMILKEIASKFKIHLSMIHYICQNKNWKHIC